MRGATSTSSCRPARMGGPCRPSQRLLRPAKWSVIRSAIHMPSRGIVVCVEPHWLAKTTGMPRSLATLPGMAPESGPR